MFHRRGLDTKIMKIHEKELFIKTSAPTMRHCKSVLLTGLTCIDNFKMKINEMKLLELDNALSIHQHNLQFLMIEIYKIKNKINPNFMCEIFKERYLQCNLRS